MSLQFSRSMRSLRIDSFRAARIGLILAILNMLVLILWFFLARVTLYEVSTSVQLQEDGRVIAEFPPEAIARIREGQSAILRIDSGPDQTALTIPALVVGSERGGEKVELLVMVSDLPLETLGEELSGQVQVEVEYITPAELVFRTSGKVLSERQIPLSPQSFEEVEP